MTAPVAPRLLLAAIAGAVLSLAAPVTAAQAGGCGGPDCYRHVNTPPIYETVAERVLVVPGGRVWQTRRGAYGELIGCWVEIPPRFVVRHRRVLVQPARSGWVPAHYGHGYGYGGYPGSYGPGYGGGSLVDAIGIAGASSADVGVALGFSSGSIYDGY